ncbi:MAG: site-specific integrase [Phycisphaerae bacterium]
MSVGTSNPFFAEPYALKRWKRGPLGSYLDGFARRLDECGYSPPTGGNYVRCVGHLSLWLAEKGFEAHQLDERKICDHLQALKNRRGVVVSGAPHRLLLSYLREIGVIPRPAPRAASKIDHIVGGYIEHLRHVRGLAESTLVHRRLFARRFLEERFRDEPIRLSRLTAQDVIRHIQGHTGEYGVLYRSGIVMVLRDFYRFLHLAGHVREDIAAGIPMCPHWKAPARPEHLERSELERLLETCVRTTPKDLRDYAILVLLVRLGVRAGEVRNLTLDDIDWEAGRITVCGKGGKCRQLPLLHEVGQALVAYLKEGRPPSRSRHVFIRMRAPLTGLSCTGGIYKIVSRALRRAGLSPSRWGPHLLRHSFATYLRGQGTSLSDVGRMLGHDDVNSALVYAHVAPNELRSVVQPWPGGVS